MINEFGQKHCLKKTAHHNYYNASHMRSLHFIKLILTKRFTKNHALQLPIHLPFGKAGSPKTSYMKVIEKCSSEYAVTRACGIHPLTPTGKHELQLCLKSSH